MRSGLKKRTAGLGRSGLVKHVLMFAKASPGIRENRQNEWKERETSRKRLNPLVTWMQNIKIRQLSWQVDSKSEEGGGQVETLDLGSALRKWAGALTH